MVQLTNSLLTDRLIYSYSVISNARERVAKRSSPLRANLRNMQEHFSGK